MDKERVTGITKTAGAIPTSGKESIRSSDQESEHLNRL